MHNRIKERMEKQGLSQVDAILALQKKDIVVSTNLMSSILRGVYTYDKAKIVLRELDKILTERESNSRSK